MPRILKSLSATDIFAIAEALRAGADAKELLAQYDISRSTLGTIRKKYSDKSQEQIEAIAHDWNKYRKIFAAVFGEKAQQLGPGLTQYPFTTKDIAAWKRTLKLEGGNPYDLKYNAKGRGSLPADVQATAASGFEWRIVPTGKGEYLFKQYPEGEGVFELDTSPVVVKVPDALPAIVERYARDDEQALLARIRYNNLVSVFLGLTTYSLQSHWKTSRTSGQVEVDEMYVGLDHNGAHYAIPVEAKGRAQSEKLSAEQILANYDAAAANFPNTSIICVAAKVVDDYTFALIKFEVDREAEEVNKTFERHYTIASNPTSPQTPRPIITEADLSAYAKLSAKPSAEADEGLA